MTELIAVVANPSKLIATRQTHCQLYIQGFHDLKPGQIVRVVVEDE